MKKTPPKLKVLAALGSAVLTALAFAPESGATPTLTNSLVAYWPMDAINGNVLTPDVGPNGFDLQPLVNKAPVAFNGVNITQAINGGPHVNINGNQNGTNALVFSVSQSTILGYIANPASPTGYTNLMVPPLNQPNWTLSFWLKAAAGGGNSGNRMFAIAEVPNGNPQNILWDISQYSSDNTQIDHFRRAVPSVIGGIQFSDDNGNGDHAQTTNVVIFDGNWHNVTIIAQTVTNRHAPIMDPTQFGNPTNGSVTITWTNAISLDSVNANATNQVNTNQNYLVQVATNLQGPWTTLSTQGSGGNNVSMTFTDSNPTNGNAFYRAVQPAFRLQTRSVYVDGQPAGWNSFAEIDPLLPVSSIESHPAINGSAYRTNGYYAMDALAFGGFVRAAGEGGYVNASFSDAAIWNRALSQAEMQAYINDGVTNASVFTPPLFANLSAQYPAAAQGDIDLLSWTAAKPPATLNLTPGIGSVTAISSQGIGSTNAAISSNTVYQLVATRSGVSATGTVSVICVSNVAPDWHYIDSFTYLNDGPIAGQGNWLNPSHGPATTPPNFMENLEVYTSSDGNNYVGFDGFNNPVDNGDGGVAGRVLGNFQSVPGDTNSLFFRFYIDPAATNNSPVYGPVPPIQMDIGLADLGIVDAGINGGIGGGPDINISQPGGGAPGQSPIDLTCASGASGIVVTPANYSYVNDPVNGNTNGLIAGHTYSVWIDVINNYPGVVGGFGSGGEQTNAAYYAVWLQRDDWEQRTNLFSAITCTNTGGLTMNGTVYPTGYLLSQRDYSANNQDNVTLGASPNLSTLYMVLDQGQAGTALTFQPTNAVRFDDFYISTTNSFNSTVPVPAGTFTP